MSKVIREVDFPSKIVDSFKRVSLNYTDVTANNNKMYQAEAVKALDGNYYVYTVYGRVGATNPAKEFRACSSQADAEAEVDKIVKAKTKKGYVEVKLVKADVGSDVGKSKTDNTSVSIEALKKAGAKVIEEPQAQSKLHSQVQDLVRTWFGVTQEFIELNLDTKKCPLGQLSLDQITKGKDILEEARKIVHMTRVDKQELNKLTNSYYSNIPHNFGYRKLDADALRFDTNDKLDKAISLLEVFENTKDFSAVLTKKSAVDEQYKTLNAQLNYIDPLSNEWKWIDTLIHSTRAPNHGFLGKIKLRRVFSLDRGEDGKFLDIADNIASTSKGRIIPELLKNAWKQKKLLSDKERLFEKANVLPLFHGTRTANMIGITSKGLLVKHDRVGASGSMYGINALYFGFSTKSLNYTSAKGSYWASGSDKYGYMFLTDVVLGNQKIAGGAYSYSWNNLQPNYHSVWAQGGKSGVINDEFMTYKTGQNCLRFILEVECQAR